MLDARRGLRLGIDSRTAFLLSILIVLGSMVGCTTGNPADRPEPGPALTNTTESVSSQTTTDGSTSPEGYRVATLAEHEAARDDPIYGFGDFSAYSYATVPWDAVAAAMISCLRDRGWPVKPAGPTGVDFADVPLDQGWAVDLDQTRCEAGLNLPEVGVPSALDIEGVYWFWVDVVVPCYEEQGFDIPDPPSLDTFVESYPEVDWVPWRFVDGGGSSLNDVCSTNPYDYEQFSG